MQNIPSGNIAQNNEVVQMKIAIILYPSGMFSDLQVCRKCFHGLGSSPDLTGRAHSALPDSLAAVCCYI